MARKTVTVTLAGDTYEITHLGAVEAYELYNELVTAIGPKVRERAREFTELAKKETLDPAEIGALIVEFRSAIPKQLMREMRSAFAKTTRVKVGAVFLSLAEGDIFDQHFAGRMTAVDTWMLACMKHNFMGFLGESGNSNSSPQGATSSG
jgi:hypothetical protein